MTAVHAWSRAGFLRLALMGLMLFFCCAQAQAPMGVRVALVVGNGSYEAPAALPNPVNDALRMGETLRALGFQVVEVRDATRAQMLDAVARVRQQLQGKQGVGLLYYAGHGLQLDWRNYMVPVDARIRTAADVPAQAIDVAVVMEAFRAAGTRMNVIVLDACRDNPFAGGASGKGLAQLDAPPGTLLAYATAPGNVAEDGAGGNGLYTFHLLQEISKPQSRIEDVFKRTRFAVRRASGGRQIPWESTSLEEDFMFNGGAIVPARKPGERVAEQAFNEEKAAWERIKTSENVDELFAFLARYPSGSYSEVAQMRLASLQRPAVLPQPGKDGMQQAPFAQRHRDGDRYEVVIRDGLTGNVTSRSTYQLRHVGGEEFETVTLEGPPFQVRVASAFTLSDRNGTYDPPYVALPGGEFKVGNKARGRTVLTNRSGERLPIEYEVRIAARETLETAMGRLETYRVDLDAVVQNGTRVRSSSWYDPQWGFAVLLRTEIRPNRGAPDIYMREVVARSRKG